MDSEDSEGLGFWEGGTLISFFFWGIYIIWLVVSTPLKNISQNGNLPQIGVKIKNIWNHQLVMIDH